MKKILLITLILIIPTTALAVCGQNSDSITILEKGETTSDVFLIINKDWKVYSVCPEGECYSNFYSNGSANGISFAQVLDSGLAKKIQEIIEKSKSEVLEKNSGFSKNSEFFLNYTDIYSLSKVQNILDKEKDNISDNIKIYPFLDIDKIPNKFNYNNCSYKRWIKYDISEGRIVSHTDTSNIFSLPQNHPVKISLYLLVVLVVIIALIIVAIIFKNKKK